MVKVIINGENRELISSCNVTQMLKELELTGKRLAVEINRELITRAMHETTNIHENDTIEIVTLVGGG